MRFVFKYSNEQSLEKYISLSIEIRVIKTDEMRIGKKKHNGKITEIDDRINQTTKISTENATIVTQK